MIQIRKEENQKKQKEKKLKVYKVNTHKKTVIALWVLLAVSFLFAVYKNFTAIDIHTVHETKVIEEQILDTHKIENFVKNFAEVYYSWEQSAASIDSRTNALKGYLTGELQVIFSCWSFCHIYSPIYILLFLFHTEYVYTVPIYSHNNSYACTCYYSYARL